MTTKLYFIGACLLAAGSGFSAVPNGNVLGVDIYPDRPVSRPAAYHKSSFESTAVRVAGGDVIQRAEQFNSCFYDTLQMDGKNWLLWEFSIKPGRMDAASLVLDEKSDFIRVRPEAVSFKVANLGTEPIAFYGVLQELDWTPASDDQFYSWHTDATDPVLPGETRTLRLEMENLYSYGSQKPSSGREPVSPMSLTILVQDLKPDTDYKVALRGLTVHTAPSDRMTAQNAQMNVFPEGDSEQVHYRCTVTGNDSSWQRAYLEVRRDPEVFWRTDITDQLKNFSGDFQTETLLPPLLPKGNYEIGIAIDGRRVNGSAARAVLGTERKPGFPTVTLEQHTGRPTIKIDGNPFIWAGYASYEWQPGPLEDFGKEGVNLFVVPCNAGRHMHQISPPLMAEPGRLDFGSLEESILLSLSAQPEAKILLRISLAMPPHLLRKMPEDIARVRTPAGDVQWEETGTLVASYTSENWRQEQAALMRKLFDFVSQQPYADRIIGACITAGATEEWFMYGSHVHPRQFADYSPVNEQAFVRWCREQGFPYEQIPNPEQRLPEMSGSDIFPDDANGRAATAYARFMSEASADAVRFFCKDAKQATGGKLLTGTMYAYVLQLAGEPRQHLANNLNMTALLDAPEFDFFMGIPLHNFRKVLTNGYDTFVTAVSSAQLHGKTYVNENDLFSWLHNAVWHTLYDPEHPREAAIKMHQRVNASDVVYGNQSEWFGLFASWHYDPKGELQKAFGQINRIKRDSSSLDRKPVEEIAFLIDDASYNWTTPDTKITDHQLPRFLYALARTGAPVGLYLLSDIDRLPERIGLVVIPWAPAMSPATRTKLVTALKQGGRDFYLTGPVGLVDTDPVAWKWDEEKMREDFGLPLHVSPSFDSSSQLICGVLPNGYELSYQPKVKANPCTLWNQNDQFGIRPTDKGTVYWSSLSINDETFLTQLTDVAGIHRYAPEGYTVHAAEGVISVTAPVAAKATEIRFRANVEATDLYTGETCIGAMQKWDFSDGQTRLLVLKKTGGDE